MCRERRSMWIKNYLTLEFSKKKKNETFIQGTQKEVEGVSHTDIQGKNIPGRGNGKVRAYLELSRNTALGRIENR